MKEQQAFPTIKGERQGEVEVWASRKGMTMRQYYKAAALQGLLASGYNIDRYQRAANICGSFADAMLAEDEEHAKRGKQ